MGWSVVKYKHHVQILGFWNILIKTPGLKHIFQKNLAANLIGVMQRLRFKNIH